MSPHFRKKNASLTKHECMTIAFIYKIKKDCSLLRFYYKVSFYIKFA